MRNTWLVFLRDYFGYVRAWGFWLGVLATPVLIALVLFFMGLAAASQPTRYFAVVESGGEVYAQAIDQEFEKTRVQLARSQLLVLEQLGQLDRNTIDAFDAAVDAGADPFAAARDAGAPDGIDVPQSDYIRVPAPAATPDGLRPWLLGDRLIDGPEGEKPLFAAVIVGADGIEYWSENVTVFDLRSRVQDAAKEIARRQVFAAANVNSDILTQADNAALEVVEKRARPEAEQAEIGDEVTTADRAPFFAVLGIAYVLWLMIFSVIQYLLMGTIEERSNKIFDTLLTSVRLPQLLAGKLGAVFAVTLTLMGSWTLGGIVVTLLAQSAIPAEVMDDVTQVTSAILQPSIIIPALISFVLGYLMYGVVFMALGSLCDTIQEAQTLLSPMMMLLMLPMIMIVIAFNDVESPIVAAASWVPIFTPFLLILRMPSEPALWEVLAQFGLMAATTFVIMWAATKVYRAGAVHGASINDALGWIKGLIPGMGGDRKATDSSGGA